MQNGASADECVQLDMAEDILKILFEKDLKVGIGSMSSHPGVLLVLTFGHRRGQTGFMSNAE